MNKNGEKIVGSLIVAALLFLAFQPSVMASQGTQKELEIDQNLLDKSIAVWQYLVGILMNIIAGMSIETLKLPIQGALVGIYLVNALDPVILIERGIPVIGWLVYIFDPIAMFEEICVGGASFVIGLVYGLISYRMMPK